MIDLILNILVSFIIDTNAFEKHCDTLASMNTVDSIEFHKVLCEEEF